LTVPLPILSDSGFSDSFVSAMPAPNHPKPRILPIQFWLPLLLVAGTLIVAPQLRQSQPPLQSHTLALLLCGTVALSGYLFAVIAQPEKF
jgi:hypothetical protein